LGEIKLWYWTIIWKIIWKTKI